jgi:hypothetical protein
MQSTLISYKEAAKRLPELTGHPAVDATTIYRWVISGVRGPSGATVKLKATRSGGRRFLQVEDIKEFIRECNGGTEPQVSQRRATSLTMAQRRNRAKRINGATAKGTVPRVQSQGRNTGSVRRLHSGGQIQDQNQATDRARANRHGGDIASALIGPIPLQPVSD